MLKEENKLYSVDEYYNLPKEMTDGTELVDGRIVPIRGLQMAAGHEHGAIAADILTDVGSFVRRNELGKVYIAETGFVLDDEGTVSAPDIAFVRKERLPQPKRTGFFIGPPDLAVEVISPSESFDSVEDKIERYFDAGTMQVWIVRPRARSISVYHSPEDLQIYDETRTVSGGDLLPGFELPVSTIFETLE